MLAVATNKIRESLIQLINDLEDNDLEEFKQTEIKGVQHVRSTSYSKKNTAIDWSKYVIPGLIGIILILVVWVAGSQFSSDTGVQDDIKKEQSISDVPPNPCENITCLNGGVCLDGKCDCPPDYTGNRCQTKKQPQDPCKNIACLNGGVCLDGKCDCPPDYTGDRCQTLKTPKWGDSKWVAIGAQKSHGDRGAWLSNGYFITQIDLDGGNDYSPHDVPFIGRVRASNLASGNLWNNCNWINIGPQKSHQSSPIWLQEGYFISQIDLDGASGYSGHDSPIIGRVKACNLLGYSGWEDCKWVEIGMQKSHQGSGTWCPDGYFITQLDLDADSRFSAHDSPGIGKIRCCKPSK